MRSRDDNRKANGIRIPMHRDKKLTQVAVQKEDLIFSFVCRMHTLHLRACFTLRLIELFYVLIFIHQLKGGWLYGNSLEQTLSLIIRESWGQYLTLPFQVIGVNLPLKAMLKVQTMTE